MVGCYLDFTLEKLRNIQHENESQDLCKVALLDTWNKREGREATYLKLVRVLYRRNRHDLVEILCAKLKSTLSLVPLSGNIAGLDLPSETLQQPNSIGFPLDVSERIESLEEQFGTLHDRFLTELIDRGVTVDRLLQALTLLPLTLRKQYESTIQSMLPELENREVIRNIFHRLNPLFTFIDYKLLQHLVSKFGSAELKTEMTLYVEKVQLFKKVTMVSELIDYWPGLEVPQVSYSRLRAKFDDDPGTYTLEELDSFRRKFFNHLRLSEFVSVSILMLLESTNSFIAVWYLPTLVIPEVLEAFSQLDSTFLQIEQILMLSLDERILYQLTPPEPIEKFTRPLSASANIDIPSLPTRDVLYSLLVFIESSHSVHNVYISVHLRNSALKILKLQHEHNANVVIKEFKFKQGDHDPCLKLVLEKNPLIVGVQPKDGMIRATDIKEESGHITDLQFWRTDYHFKISLRRQRQEPLPPIKFEGSSDDSQLQFLVTSDGKLKVWDALINRQRDSTSKQSTATVLKFMPNNDIQFGYHSIISGKNITSDGLRAERMNPDVEVGNGTAYGAHPLKGRAEFEVKIDSYGAGWLMSMLIGVMKSKKGVPLEEYYGTITCQMATNYCTWGGLSVYNYFVPHTKESCYGYVDLRDLREGDHVGLRISEGGVLEFTVNGESQGIAAENIYTKDSDIYAVVDHYGQCVATVITKAVTQYYENINLQELCLDELFSCLKSGDKVDRLPLPTSLKDKLREYF